MRSRPELQIRLPEDRPDFYSTGDVIQGHVGLEIKDDTVIDEVSITLEGKTIVQLEEHVFLSPRAGYVVGNHTFLRLSHPNKSLDLLEPRHSCGQQSYTIPFNFTVPGALLPYACSHTAADGSAIRRAHLLLPPSFGTSQTNGVFSDDPGPKRAKVTYTLHVKVRKQLHKGGSITLEKSRPVCVIPTRDEEPPVLVEENDTHYRLLHEKDISRGPSTIGKAIGRLIATMSELPALLLPHLGDANDNIPVLTAAVNLRFQSARSGETPPQLNSVTIKLRSFTFFGALACETIPKPGDFQEDRTGHTQYINTTRLEEYVLNDVKWSTREFTDIAADLRHRSRSSNASTIPTYLTPTSTKDEQPPYYTASLQIPIRLPRRTSNQTEQKLFTPTFSSCTISRAYSLELKISYKTASATSHQGPKETTIARSIARSLTPWSHLTLTVPLQIRLPSEACRVARLSVQRNSVSSDRNRAQLDDGLDDLSAEQRPPAYTAI